MAQYSRTTAGLLVVVSLATAAQVPSGTQLQIRLFTPINTATAKANQPFSAVIVAPAIADDRVVISAGVKVTGYIQEVKPAEQVSDQAVLDLAFERITDDSGKSAPIKARIKSVDNARETIDENGKLLGIIAQQTGSGRLDQGISKVTQKYPGLGDLLGAVKGTVLKAPDGNIDYETGTEMTLELTKALDWRGANAGPSVGGIQPEGELARMVDAQPFRTTSEKPPRPSDMTNLIFLGSRIDLENAFIKAGWSTAAELNGKSKLETFKAMAEQRGYQEAPVSTLLLDGRSPDLVFAARHHLRIWKRPGLFNGQEIWVCAATHDIGIDFSEQNRTFIHKVDSQIDRERAKVVADLLFTGLVRGLVLVEREEVPTNFSNATGDKLETDGRLAVLSF
jgi:hypothetical protein